MADSADLDRTVLDSADLAWNDELLLGHPAMDRTPASSSTWCRRWRLVLMPS
jgi:hypothetical protein